MIFQDVIKKIEDRFQRSLESFPGRHKYFEIARNWYEFGLFMLHIGNDARARLFFESACRLFKQMGEYLYAEILYEFVSSSSNMAHFIMLQNLVDTGHDGSGNQFPHRRSMAGNIHDVLDEIMVRAVQISGAVAGCLYIENEGGTIESGTTAITPVQGDRIPPDSLVAYAFKTGQTIPVPGHFSNNAPCAEWAHHSDGLKVMLPVKLEKAVICVCFLEIGHGASPFIEEDGQLLSLFLSEYASFTIQNILQHRDISTKAGHRERAFTETTRAKIEKAREYIGQHYHSSISREGLAAMLDMDCDNLGRFFKLFTGMKINECINRLRVEEAAKRLHETDENVLTIALGVGFENISTFNRSFIKIFHKTPTEFRREK